MRPADDAIDKTSGRAAEVVDYARLLAKSGNRWETGQGFAELAYLGSPFALWICFVLLTYGMLLLWQPFRGLAPLPWLLLPLLLPGTLLLWTLWLKSRGLTPGNRWLRFAGGRCRLRKATLSGRLRERELDCRDWHGVECQFVVILGSGQSSRSQWMDLAELEYPKPGWGEMNLMSNRTRLVALKARGQHQVLVPGLKLPAGHELDAAAWLRQQINKQLG
ncbi:MAG TPA: hypothetical protein V6D23_14960 [Candidatus Obscuribacterales bacterium]